MKASEVIEINRYFPSKYDEKDFNEKLKLSQSFVNEILNNLLNWGYIARPFDDKNPWHLPTGIEVRGLDICSGKKGHSFFIDAKDFSQCIWYRATGIPIYLYERYCKLEAELGMSVYLFFRDNKNWEIAVSREQNRKVESSFKKGSLFLPYGGRMGDFQKFWKKDIPHKHLCKDGRIIWLEQIIWDLRSLKTLAEIFNPEQLTLF